MKYETPELTALTTAINAIQGVQDKKPPNIGDNPVDWEGPGAYQDWE
jgi:hypothetical protein